MPFGTMGSRLGMVPEPGVSQGLGVLPLFYWEEGSLGPISATGTELTANRPQKYFSLDELQVSNKHMEL